MIINNTIFAIILVIVLLLTVMSIALAYIHMTKYSNVLSVREFLKKYIKNLISKGQLK